MLVIKRSFKLAGNFHVRKGIRQIHHVLLDHRYRVRVLADYLCQRALSNLCKLFDIESNEWIAGFEPVSVALS